MFDLLIYLFVFLGCVEVCNVTVNRMLYSVIEFTDHDSLRYLKTLRRTIPVCLFLIIIFIKVTLSTY